MREDARLAFLTPKGKYEVLKQVPANELARGRVEVTATGTEFYTASGVLYLTSAAGVLYLASADGIRAIQPGADADLAVPQGIPTWALAGGVLAVIGGTTAALALISGF
jgi:hypothetical protein